VFSGADKPPAVSAARPEGTFGEERKKDMTDHSKSGENI
jgi:hypothetical protein